MKNVDPEETKMILTRLKTVQGHISGVERMLTEEKKCEEIFLQLVAIRSAIHKISVIVAQRYAHTCMTDAIEEGEDLQAVMNRAIEALLKLNQ
ncbi:metal-sensitive transcriptional regulator [Desulfosporosinus sp. SB140]|uniref:metal-sensitive transcriptional regulator n=1 Tax=Desulfosporosinus paludis TaxID=3115649 RepID=UPI00389098F2